ncbi:hypothetical protein O9929_23200 [Vibrio lentus]|nr:hypothetical protein [Vibrio lentus]
MLINAKAHSTEKAGSFTAKNFHTLERHDVIEKGYWSVVKATTLNFRLFIFNAKTPQIDGAECPHSSRPAPGF